MSLYRTWSDVIQMTRLGLWFRERPWGQVLLMAPLSGAVAIDLTLLDSALGYLAEGVLVRFLHIKPLLSLPFHTVLLGGGHHAQTTFKD